MKAIRTKLLKLLAEQTGLFVKGLIAVILLGVTCNSVIAESYGELHFDDFGNETIVNCISQLREAEILTLDMTYLGTNLHMSEHYTLMGVTAVTEGPDGDEYYVMSCRINLDKSGMVAGPVAIARGQAHFTSQSVSNKIPAITKR